MPGSNAAQRVLRCLTAASEHNDSKNYAAVLVAIAGAKRASDQQLMREAARLIESIHQQIDRAEAGLRALSFPEDLYLTQFNRVREAFMPHMVNSNWGQARGQITPELTLAFKWSAFALPDDGAQVDSTELQQVIVALEALLDDDFLMDLPPSVQESLRHAFEVALAAAKAAPIEGAEPTAQSLRTVLSEVEIDRETIAEYAKRDGRGAEFGTKVRQVIARFVAAVPKALDGVARQGERAEKISKLVTHLNGAVTTAFDWLDRLPPPSP